MHCTQRHCLTQPTAVQVNRLNFPITCPIPDRKCTLDKRSDMEYNADKAACSNFVEREWNGMSSWQR